MTPGHDPCRHLHYLVTCDQYDEMWKRAGGRCQICGRDDWEKPQIDHDPTLGDWAVRGLLCVPCNTWAVRGPVVDAVAAYLATPWFLSVLSACGLSTDPPEPPPGSKVRDWNGHVWVRNGRWGWHRRDLAKWKRKTYAWPNLVRKFGPHNLHAV